MSYTFGELSTLDAVNFDPDLNSLLLTGVALKDSKPVNYYCALLSEVLLKFCCRLFDLTLESFVLLSIYLY